MEDWDELIQLLRKKKLITLSKKKNHFKRTIIFYSLLDYIMAKFITLNFKKHRAKIINLEIAHSNYYMEQYKICYNIEFTD